MEKKTWTKEQIVNLINTNDDAVMKAVERIYSFQTEDEKVTATTRLKNNRGFNAIDAKLMTSIVNFYKTRGFLTKKQIEITRKKILKYSKQLTDFANGVI